MNNEHEDFWRHRKDVKSGRWVNLPGDIPVGPLDDFLDRGWEVVS